MVRERDEVSSLRAGSAVSSSFGVVCGSCFGSGSGSGAVRPSWIPLAPGHEPLIR